MLHIIVLTFSVKIFENKCVSLQFYDIYAFVYCILMYLNLSNSSKDKKQLFDIS